MSKFVKLNLEATKLLGVILKAVMKGEDRITLNLNPRTLDSKEGTPDYQNDLASVWINESKY